jgi:hypothetical protein
MVQYVLRNSGLEDVEAACEHCFVGHPWPDLGLGSSVGRSDRMACQTSSQQESSLASRLTTFSADR